MQKYFVFALLLLWSASTIIAAEFHVAPGGQPGGDGSAGEPWDLQTALNHPAALLPGDTLWLRGGVHRFKNRPTKFVSDLAGAPGLPITVRQFPGERATVDGNIQQKTGGWVNYWGFEIMNSQQWGNGTAPSRYTSETGPFPTTWWVNYDGKLVDFCVSGFDLQAPNVKLINLVIHDHIGGGIGANIAAGNTEISGCLIYYNGWQGGDRGHGHGIYGQNAAPAVKRLRDCLVLDNFALGMQATGNGPSPVADNFDVQGCAFFLNGALASHHQANLLIGAYQGVARNPVIVSNFIFDTMGSRSDFSLGYYGGTTNALVRGNYFQTGARFGHNGGMTLQGNMFLGGTIGLNPGNYPCNTCATTTPAANVVFMRPNPYEPGRAHVLVYNWEMRPAVEVNLSSIVPVGSRFEVRNAQDFFGAPVAAGRYGGGKIALPLAHLSVATPVGIAAPPVAGPLFNAFVVLSGASSTNHISVE